MSIAAIDGRGAQGAYAFAGMDNVSGRLPPNREFGMTCAVVDESFLQCDLNRSGLVGLQVFIKPRADGNVMILFTGNGRTFTGGLMSRV